MKFRVEGVYRHVESDMVFVVLREGRCEDRHLTFAVALSIHPGVRLAWPDDMTGWTCEEIA